jgi:HK97 family phage prohead protease
MALLGTTADGVQIADFEFAFSLGEKAVVTEGDEGELYIEGLAADLDVDRQEEAFEPGAFEDGLKAYMTSNPILLYHHKSDTALGQVVDATLVPEGLHVKARVDKPEPGTMIADYVRKIKNGTLRAFSVGGKFYRRMTEKGPRIFKCDLGEISVTPYPVNPRTLFAVAGKAFEPGAARPLLEDASVADLEARLARVDAVLAEAEGKAVKNKRNTGSTASANSNPGSGGRGGGSNFGTGGTSSGGQGHPDRGHVAALLMHVQKVHTLAENAAQNAADPEVADVANKAANSLKKHSQALHHIAARIGPLPDYYGPLA